MSNLDLFGWISLLLAIGYYIYGMWFILSSCEKTTFHKFLFIVAMFWVITSYIIVSKQLKIGNNKEQKQRQTIAIPKISGSDNAHFTDRDSVNTF